jgi:hypothetical protein
MRLQKNNQKLKKKLLKKNVINLFVNLIAVAKADPKKQQAATKPV